MARRLAERVSTGHPPVFDSTQLLLGAPGDLARGRCHRDNNRSFLVLADYRFETVTDHVGQELGVSPWMTVNQSQIDQFAEVTGDHQWIHVDLERCKAESPYGAPIAHGFLTLSLLARLLMDVGMVPPDVRQAVNAGVNNVRFKTPVRAGARVRARASVLSAERKGEGRMLATASAILEVEGEKHPALSAEVTVMLFRGEAA